MAMAKIEGALLKAKFKGSLLGSLMGDCLGSPFEGDIYSPGMKLTVKKYFEKLDGPYFETPRKGYTDDTAMTKSVAQCLIEKPAVDYVHLAKLFTEEYMREPRRGYGGNVIDTFYLLKREKYADVFAPAKLQFHGKGSFGNGGAMRVAPLALFFYKNPKGMIEAVTKSTQITHTHELGINGALLQAFAIQESLSLDPKDKIDIGQFASNLIEKMCEIEGNDPGTGDEDLTPYQTQLKYMNELLNITNPDDPVTEEEVIGMLGTSVSALHSVPTAIYCFLKSFTGFPGVETDNIFRRAIQYAVTLGGDTDTIASMTGAISGAYFGDSVMSKNLLKHCEYVDKMQELAEKLYEASETCNMPQKVNVNTV